MTKNRDKEARVTKLIGCPNIITSAASEPDQDQITLIRGIAHIRILVNQ